MKPRTTIVLAGVLALLCLAYWGLEFAQQSTERRVEEAKKLFAFPPAAVQSVTIEREGERPSTGVREGADVWKVTEPFPVRPNPEIWERIAKTLAGLTNERTIAQSPDDLDQYGLQKPVLKVSAKTQDGKTAALSFGSLDPTKKYRYALGEDGAVFLVTPENFFELDRSLLTLRDRYLFEHIEDGITRLEFARIRPSASTDGAAGSSEMVEESVPVIVEMGDNGQWHVLEPVTGLADQEMVQNLIGEVQYAVGRGYVDQPENLSDYGLDPPKARITVRCGKNGPPQTVYYGVFERQTEQGGVFVRREGAPEVFVVDAQVVTLFPAKPEAFNEKRILTRPAAGIRTLKYEAGPQTFTLENPEGKGWRLVEPPGMETDQGAVSRFIGAVASAKGTDYFVERTPAFGLDSPAIRMTLTYADSPAPQEILVGAQVPNSDAYYATQDTGAVTTLDKPMVDAWRATYTDFVSKGLLAFKKSEATQVSLMIDGVNYVFTKGERAWVVDEPRGKIWESQDDMDALLATLESCIADAVDLPAAPADLTPYGLREPFMTVRLAATTGGQGQGAVIVGPLSLGNVSEADPHQRYALVANRPELFRIRQLVVEQIRDILKGVVDAAPVAAEAPPVKIVQ